MVTEAQLKAAFMAARGHGKILDDDVLRDIIVAAENATSRTDIPGWDEYKSDTYFSGLVFRYPRDEHGNLDSELIIVGRYYAK